MDERPRYMLYRIIPADYQNGNTLKAFTLNVTRRKQMAMGDDLDALKDYAEAMKTCAPLYIEDQTSGELVYKID